MKYFFAVKNLTVKMQMKMSINEWKEELEKFKESVIEIVDLQIKTAKALERFSKIRNISYKALKEVEMKKLEELCDQCYKNWDINEGKIREEIPSEPSYKYEPTRFSDPREISIARYFTCIKNREQEESKGKRIKQL
jgi:hypothetical protein